MPKKPYPFSVCEQCAGGGTSGGDVDLSNYLSKDNEEEYTPISDYNPATKSYVDGEINRVETTLTTQVGQNVMSIQNLTSELHDDYYDKNTVNGAIAEVDKAIAEIDVTSGEDGVSSDTVTVNVGTTRTTTYDLTDVSSVNIPVISDDTKITINSSVSVNMAYVYLENGTTENLNPNSSTFEVDLTNYSGVYQVSVVPTGATIESWSLTATITSSKPCVFAYLKYGSVNGNHLSLGLKDSLVMKTDYATNKTAGVVKTSASDGVGINNGNLYLAYAGTDEINKKNGGRAIVPFTIDHAISKGTHQTMADDYEPITLKVASNMSGNQGQLPASYDAVKGYIDSSISDLIEKLKAAGVNID